jgi:hypothetical protein
MQLMQVLFPAAVLAHGSVTAEGDLCIIRIGFYTAHFKVFQPGSSQEKEFCEDLPATGESIFVMEYLHQGLSGVPIEFRIIRDVTGLGRFARIEDLAGITDLDAVTVFHQQPTIAPGVFTVLHDFPESGDFLGLVTVKHPQTDQYYSALFPFSVGFRGWGFLPLFAALAVLAQFGYWLSTGAFARWRAARKARQEGANKQAQILMLVPLLLLMGAQSAPDGASWLSNSGAYKASYRSAVTPVPLNRMHSWILHLETANGEPLENAEVAVSGGMPAHNHGLPTAPVVTGYLGNGDYQVDGLRFHMQGAWELTVSISHDKARDSILIPLTL